MFTTKRLQLFTLMTSAFFNMRRFVRAHTLRMNGFCSGRTISTRASPYSNASSCRSRFQPWQHKPHTYISKPLIGILITNTVVVLMDTFVITNDGLHCVQVPWTWALTAACCGNWRESPHRSGRLARRAAHTGSTASSSETSAQRPST